MDEISLIHSVVAVGVMKTFSGARCSSIFWIWRRQILKMFITVVIAREKAFDVCNTCSFPHKRILKSSEKFYLNRTYYFYGKIIGLEVINEAFSLAKHKIQYYFHAVFFFFLAFLCQRHFISYIRLFIAILPCEIRLQSRFRRADRLTEIVKTCCFHENRIDRTRRKKLFANFGPAAVIKKIRSPMLYSSEKTLRRWKNQTDKKRKLKVKKKKKRNDVLLKKGSSPGKTTSITNIPRSSSRIVTSVLFCEI